DSRGSTGSPRGPSDFLKTDENSPPPSAGASGPVADVHHASTTPGQAGTGRPSGTGDGSFEDDPLAWNMAAATQLDLGGPFATEGTPPPAHRPAATGGGGGSGPSAGPGSVAVRGGSSSSAGSSFTPPAVVAAPSAAPAGASPVAP